MNTVYLLDFRGKVGGSEISLGGLTALIFSQEISTDQFQTLVNAAITEGAEKIGDVVAFLVRNHGFQEISFVRAVANW